MPTVATNGLRLHYEDEGDGAPLVCVMGLASDSTALAPQRAAFTERHRVIAFDNRDAGRSSRAHEDYVVQDMADDTIGLVDALGLDAFHLLGVSLGSAVSQHVALRQPDRIRTLTLAATWSRFAPGWARLRAKTWEREAVRGSREELLEEFLLLTATEAVFEDEAGVADLLRAALDNPHPQELDALIRQMRAMEHHDVRDRLGELTMPVHVIAGDRDVLIPHWKGRELCDAVPHGTFTLLEGTGHAMNAERAEDFNRVVLEFLDANP